MSRSRQSVRRPLPSRSAARAAMGPGTQLPGPSGRTVSLVMGERLGGRTATPRLSGAVARPAHRRRG